MSKAMKSIIVCLFIFTGCGTTQQFTALPNDMDRSQVPVRVIEMKAMHFDFVPEVVKVHAGTLVTLKITAVDGTHGFELPAFGIDVRLDEGKTTSVEFYVPRAGEFKFHCSHLCGFGHFGMSGKVIAE